jgi:tetratricopeptide (TPR) repeat protein
MPRSLPLPLPLLALAVIALAGPPLEAHEAAGARRNLAQGRDALARKDYPAALAHLRSAVSSFDPKRDREELGDAWLQLGIASLNGLGKPEEALPAFLASAAASPEPSTAWLWASVAAEKLGRMDEAAAYRLRAVPPPTPTAPPAPVAEAPALAAPAAEPVPQASPEPAVQAPVEKPDAVQHFFGEAEPRQKAKDEKDGKDEKDEEKKDEKKVDAFDYFFGEKEKPAEEKPPA